jgi:hypothetical protein
MFQTSVDCRGLIAAALCSGVQKPNATIPNCDCSVIICCTRHALYTVLPQIAAPTIPHRILHTLSQCPCRNTLNQPQQVYHLQAYSRSHSPTPVLPLKASHTASVERSCDVANPMLTHGNFPRAATAAPPRRCTGTKTSCPAAHGQPLTK